MGLFGAGDALAQSFCIGSAAAPGQRALSAGVGFPDNATDFNLRFDLNNPGPLAFIGSYTFTDVANIDPSRHTVAALVGYELGSPLIDGETPIVGCPVVGLSYSRMSEDDVTLSGITVPIGFGVGTSIAVGEGLALSPYVIPQFFFGRSTLSNNGESVSETDTGFGATLGAVIDLGQFFGGLDLVTTRWSDVGDTNSQFAIRVGLKF